jgi:PadR family transcriptional regulator, regulatory protein PadR
MNDQARPSDNGQRQAQLLKGLGELALLSMLKDRPHYGLEILERLRAEAGVELAAGTIYPLLHRLAKSGLVSAEWRLDQPDARPRKYYALSPRGEAELAALLGEWRKLSGALGAFLSRSERR